MRLDLVLLNAEKLKLEFKKDIVVIGRSTKCDIVIPHESMSRQHCQIEFRDGEFFVTDLGSSNGVFVDEEKIEPNTATPFQTYLNLSFGYVTSCHVSLEQTQAEVIQEDKSMAMQKSRSEQRPLEKVEHQKPKVSTKTRPYLLNIIAFLCILFAIYYYMTHEKPVANSPETNPQNSEITESDLF